jgi:ABC-type molybdenum transport system ATPase subunit/photorepair protein PhrA
MGSKAQVLFSLHRWADMYNSKSAQTLAVKMADKMTAAFGPPLLEVGHTLTSKGVVRYTAYEKAKEARLPRYFNVHGDMHGRILSGKKQEQFYATLERPQEEWTLDDWVMITSIIPDDFEQDKRLKPLPGSNSADRSSDSKISTAVDTDSQPHLLGEPLIELNSVIVKYGNKTVLGHPPPQPGYNEPGLNLTIRRGTRLALLGPNGSGKTTLLSLLTSDHPHSYSLPIKFFGRSRLPQLGKPGLSLWEIQSRIGHSSPEIHSFFPKGLTIRMVLESAWAETFKGKPTLTWERDEMVDAFLRWWEPELRQIWPGAARSEFHEAEQRDRRAWIKSLPPDLDEATRKRLIRGSRAVPAYMKNDIWKMMQQSYPPIVPSSRSRLESDESPFMNAAESDTSLDWAEDTRNHIFGLLPFGAQRLLLLLRAMIKQPDILVLDEAFSGLSPEVREKVMCWLEHGEEMFLEGRTVGRDDESKGTGNPDYDDQPEEQDAEVADKPDPDVKRPRGRPRQPVNARPPVQPGRPPGRPPGSLKGEAPTPWMSKARQEAEMEGEKKWVVVKVPNMRRTVERVCKAFDVEIAELQKGRLLDGPYRLVHKCMWKELVEIAETGHVRPMNEKGDQGASDSVLKPTGAVQDGEAGYRFRGLSEKQAMVVVSHVREEVPGLVNEWLRLPGEEEVSESGRGVEMGRCDSGSIRTVEGWGKVWSV